MKKFIHIILFLFLFVLSSQAQDTHFSQFYASPLTLNPANTGHFNGDWRIANNYRNQWRSLSKPYLTNAFSFDKQFHLYNQQFGGGIIVINDQSGNISLRVTKILLSLAYQHYFGQNELSLGFQAGFVNKSYSLRDLSFPEQYDRNTGQFNSSLALTETNLDNKVLYPDMNMGFVWKNHSWKLKPEAGVALFHINKPKDSYFNQGNTIAMRKVFHTSVNINLSSRIFLTPNLLYMSAAKASDLVGGSNVSLRVNENKYLIQSFFGGIYMRDGYQRNTDAAFLVAGINFKHLDVGISYDINVSSLHMATDYRGAFEISVIYTSLNTLLNKITIPCDVH